MGDYAQENSWGKPWGGLRGSPYKALVNATRRNYWNVYEPEPTRTT
jgi:hypothetical protein